MKVLRFDLKVNSFVILTILLSFLCGCSSGFKTINKSQYQQHKKITENVSNFVNSLDPALNIGIHIQSVKSGKVIYQKNADRYFTPASTLKIITALAAMSELGNDFVFETQLYLLPEEIPEQAKNETSEGNLYIRFSGDPVFSYEDLVSLFTKLKKKTKINSIKDLIIVKSDSNISVISPNWMVGDVQHCYIAPVGEPVINRNISLVSVEPSPNLSEPAVVTSKFDIYPIDNKTVTYDCHDSKIGRKLINNKLTLTGCIDRNQKSSVICIAAKDIEYFILKMARRALKEVKVELTGESSFGDLPENASIIAKHKSEPLFLILRNAMKTSDNFVFDSLFLKIASADTSEVSTWRKAGDILKDSIKKQYEIDLSDTIIVGGSGLSRYNLINPAQLSQLLRAAYNKFESFAEFISILPIGNHDGTLDKRMSDLKKQVRAKTGSLNGVSSIAGYMTTARGDILSFAIMISNYSGSGLKYKKMQDKICSLCR